MPKYHVGTNGPARCRARVRPCPIGGLSGVNHYESESEAQAAYERQMSDPEHCARIDRVSRMTFTNTEATKEVKQATDPEYIRDLYQYIEFRGGNEKFNRAVALNQNSPSDVITKVFKDSVSQGSPWWGMLGHRNFDSKIIDPDNAKEILEYCRMTSDHFPESVLCDKERALALSRTLAYEESRYNYTFGVSPYGDKIYGSYEKYKEASDREYYYVKGEQRPPEVYMKYFEDYIERYGDDELTEDEKQRYAAHLERKRRLAEQKAQWERELEETRRRRKEELKKAIENRAKN